MINLLVPRVQKIKICNLTLNQLLIIEFVKKMVHLGAHYSERTYIHTYTHTIHTYITFYIKITTLNYLGQGHPEDCHLKTRNIVRLKVRLAAF